MSERILRTPQAAAYVGLSESTLEKKRSLGTGPRFIRLGRKVVGYDISDLDQWLDAQRDNTTSAKRDSGDRAVE